MLRSLLAYFGRTKQVYQLWWRSPAGQDVLADLAVFCRATESCFHPDPRIHAMLEGRREVWLRIQQKLNLTAEQLYVLYTQRDQPTLENDQ